MLLFVITDVAVSDCCLMAVSRHYYVDVVIAVSLLVTFVCCWLSYRSHHSTRSRTERLMKDLAALQSAEDSLTSLQKQ